MYVLHQTVQNDILRTNSVVAFDHDLWVIETSSIDRFSKDLKTVSE